MPQTLLITGANRGLGLEFTQQYLAQGAQVIATCRQLEQATQLHILKERYPEQLSLYTLDVTCSKAIQACAEQLHDLQLDLLILNAGIYGTQHSTLGDLDCKGFQEVLATNTIAPLEMSQ